jgi:hypothetical protein
MRSHLPSTPRIATDPADLVVAASFAVTPSRPRGAQQPAD